MLKGLKEILTYNRKQRNGLLVLLGLIVLIQFFIFFDDFFFQEDPAERAVFEAAVTEHKRQDSINRYQSSHTPLFYFNPNKATDSVWLQLGLKDYQLAVVKKYVAKGGHFYKSTDLAKITVFDSAWVQRILPYVQLPNPQKKPKKRELRFTQFNPNTVSKAELKAFGLSSKQVNSFIGFRTKVRPFKNEADLYKPYNFDSSVVAKMLPHAQWPQAEIRDPIKTTVQRAAIMVELNGSDSIALLKLSGIGPVFASRILKYRNRLGGFVSSEQLLEVYGLDANRLESFKDQISINAQAINKLNVNTATFKELLYHPYLEYKVVKNMVEFREQMRPFKSVDELQNIELIDAVLFAKIANYLKT